MVRGDTQRAQVCNSYKAQLLLGGHEEDFERQSGVIRRPSPIKNFHVPETARALVSKGAQGATASGFTTCRAKDFTQN
jgi:hypothetical protein